MAQTENTTDLYNATARIVRRSADAMVIHVTPDGPMTRYLGGQYGSLGLASLAEPGKLIRRAYSLSSPIIGFESGQFIDHDETDYYEFYLNLVASDSDKRERLTPKLFALEDGGRIFCGQKIIGHYTFEKVPAGKDVLLISTMTGEAANNSIINSLLRRDKTRRICNVLLAEKPWVSLYAREHATLARSRPEYKHIELNDAPLRAVEAILDKCYADKNCSHETLGFELDPASCHVLLCGDPDMIGAPKKMGGWNYEHQDSGLMRLLSERGFSAGTRFKQGEIDHEAYW